MDLQLNADRQAIAYEGVFHVLVTPFSETGALDLDSLERLVDGIIDLGVDGLLALGVNGEAASLDEAERAAVLRCVLETTRARVPVVAGVSAPATDLAVRRARAAHAAGARGVMVAAPPRAEDLQAHVSTVAASVPELAVILQDYPASGHEPVTVGALARTLASRPNLVAVKAEAPPTPVRIAELAALDPSVRQLGGLGGLWLLWELRAGSAGTMTGFAYPELLVAMVEAARGGDDGELERLYAFALPALVWESQPTVGLALRKHLLVERGLISSAVTRAPSPVVASAADEARQISERLRRAEVAR